MNVGDLVKLSEYGLARSYNRFLTNKSPYQVGLVVEVKDEGPCPYKIFWNQRYRGNAPSIT